MPRKKKTRPRWYRRGEVIFQKLVRQHDPLTVGDLTQEERLELIFGQRRGIRELLEYARGDLLSLVGVDLKTLEMVPGVGPALAAKVAAFMYEIGFLCPRIRALQDGEN